MKIIKIIGEAFHDNLETIRVRYEQLALRIWNTRKRECKEIGCELIRAVQNIARINNLEPILRDLAVMDANNKPSFWNILMSANYRVNGNVYLLTSVSRKLEEKLTYVMLNVTPEAMPHCMTWLLNEFGIKEGVEEEQLILSDWVRYILVNFHMAKLMTPRWYVIGWLLNFTKHQNARAQIKLALFFDWLTYDQ
jgi:integrator complex subunit 3